MRLAMASPPLRQPACYVVVVWGCCAPPHGWRRVVLRDVHPLLRTECLTRLLETEWVLCRQLSLGGSWALRNTFYLYRENTSYLYETLEVVNTHMASGLCSCCLLLCWDPHPQQEVQNGAGSIDTYELQTRELQGAPRLQTQDSVLYA
jgi:hypothetical protein